MKNKPFATLVTLALLSTLNFQLSAFAQGTAFTYQGRLSANGSPANGQFGFRTWSPAGQVVVIEASTDLRTWTPLQTNTLGAAPLSFGDPQTALFHTRFYRLRSGP